MISRQRDAACPLSVTDADGYTVVTDFDALDRLTQRTYPDDTTETRTYSRLDLTEQTDRLGRVTRHFYDGFGRRLATRDPVGRTVSQQWCDCGALEALVDANGNRTRWERDVQGRVTREIRADNTTDTLYTYDLSGRLKTVTDPKAQVTTHTYNLDDSLAGNGYTNEVISTPDVSYTYEAYYPRIATMVDGIGTTSYAYKAASTNGAGQLATVDAGIPVFDSQGNVGLLVCGSAGIGNGLSISVGVQVETVVCPQCKSICDLEGPCFGPAGHFAKGPGISVGGGVCIGSAGVAANLSAGPAAGIGVFFGGGVGVCKLVFKRKECCP